MWPSKAAYGHRGSAFPSYAERKPSSQHWENKHAACKWTRKAWQTNVRDQRWIRRLEEYWEIRCASGYHTGIQAMRFIFWVHPLISYFFNLFLLHGSIKPPSASQGTHTSFSLDRKQERTTSASLHHTTACVCTALCCKPAQEAIQVTKKDNTKAGSFQKEALPWCDSQPRNNNITHHQWVAAQGHPSAAGDGQKPIHKLTPKDDIHRTTAFFIQNDRAGILLVHLLQPLFAFSI